MSEKLQKVLAHAGRGSRRQIEQWITEGRIQVNGRSAKLGDRVEAADRILLDGEPVFVRSQQHSQIKALIYHKPEGEIVSRTDPAGRPTVFDNLPDLADARWVSVGRLDINTSGLLLFTNSGELANKLMHPSTGLEREYLVRIRGRLSPESVGQLTRTGVDLDGQLARFESVYSSDMGDEGSNHWYRVVIKEGRYREVRRMFEAVNHLVSRLKRIRYGSIKLTRDIKLGQSAKMAPLQLEKLIATAGLESEFADRSSVNKMRATRGERSTRSTDSDTARDRDSKRGSTTRGSGKPVRGGARTDRSGSARQSEQRGQQSERPERQSEPRGRQSESRGRQSERTEQRGERSTGRNNVNSPSRRDRVHPKSLGEPARNSTTKSKSKRKPKSPRRVRG